MSSSNRLAVWLVVLSALQLLVHLPDARAQAPGGATLTAQHQYICAEDLKPEIVLAHDIPFCQKVDRCGPRQGPVWEVVVDPAAQSIVLQFQGFSQQARKSIKIKGNGKWEADGRLRLARGETTISGVRPDSSGRWPLVSAATVLGSSKEETIPPPLTSQKGVAGSKLVGDLQHPLHDQRVLSIRLFLNDGMVSRTDYLVYAQPCKVGSGTGTPTNQQLAIANFGSPSVVIFFVGANGNVVPNRIIDGPHTGLGSFDLEAIASDTKGRIYILEGGRITVFESGAHDDATPMKALLFDGIDPILASIAADEHGGVFVANASSRNVLVFSSGASGTVVPIATLTDGIAIPVAIAVNAPGTRIFIANADGTIAVYRKTDLDQFVLATTIPRPANVIAAPDANFWQAIAVDSAGTVYASRGFADLSVFAFGEKPDGTFEVVRQFTLADFPRAIAADRTGQDRIGHIHAVRSGTSSENFVSNAEQSYLSNPGSATGPVSMITGANTRLDGPVGIAVLP